MQDSFIEQNNLIEQNSVLKTSILTSLLEGNRRFAEGKSLHSGVDIETRKSLIDGQNPNVVVLSCADSRVAPEFIFDAGLGDIFSVRSAGEVVDDAVLASLEYAVSDLHVKLLVVLGHENCGAVKAVLPEVSKIIKDIDEDDVYEAIESSKSILLRALGSAVVSGIEDSLETDDIERIHVSNVLMSICDKSEVIREAMNSEKLMIVGARYRMSDGLVEILSC